VYKAFAAAKDLVQLPGREFASIYFDLALLPASERKVLDVDPYPYGVQANRAMLEALTQFSHEQGLTERRLKLEEVFYPATLDL
jgi:4,5-dihydroxyphthalate decarboxylase